MNNLRLTVIMFILAVALAAAILVGFGSAGSPAPASSGGRAAPPPVDPTAFKAAGLKTAPWEGSQVAQSAPTPEPRPAAAPEPGVAVVELYTSEGCSSCPPADVLLSELCAPTPGDRCVIAVAFHVDYWDKLGWKDRFASAAFTRRQRDLAALLRADVYTPQAIVNGHEVFVGSDRTKMTAAIDAALGAPAKVRVKAETATAIEPGKPVTVNVHIERPAGATEPAALESLKATAVLVEDGLSTKVARGENEGRELRHDGVCRGFAESKVAIDGAAKLELATPADLNAAKCRIVVWVSGEANPRVLGAAKALLPAK